MDTRLGRATEVENFILYLKIDLAKLCYIR